MPGSAFSALCRVAFAAALSVLPVSSALAERYALLVGVSAYPALRQAGLGDKDLRGPRNDVRLLADALRPHGFAPGHVTILADGVSSQAPTRAAILAAFDRAVDRLQPGDVLFVHFAGHGAQQPERVAGQEPDGLDEIFLPADAGKWDERTGTVVNAITDDEIAERLQRAAAMGASTWSVFDSCHAGSLTRGTLTARGLTARELGIPALPGRNAPADLTIGLRKASVSVPAQAPAVGFFAAGARATTTEFRPRPLGEVYGLFTYVLVEGLRSHPGITYRQLAEFVQQRYGALAMADGGTPEFEGDLDAPLFGDATVPRLRQWPVTMEGGAMWVEAGTLSLFGEGARFAVVADPRAPDADAVAQARAVEVTATRARLEFVTSDGGPAAAPPKLGTGVYARLRDPNPSFEVRVTVRPGLDAGGRAIAVRPDVAARLKALQAAAGFGPRVQWVPPTEDADVELVVADTRVFLKPRAAPLVTEGADATLSVAVPGPGATAVALDAFGETLQRELRRVAKTVNLLRVANQHLPDPDDKLRVWVVVREQRTGKIVMLNPSDLRQLAAGDEMYLFAENGARHGADLTILAVDARSRMQVVFPSATTPDNHLPAFTARRQLGDGFEITDDTPGLERLVILASRRLPGSSGQRADFRYLAEDDVRSGRTRSLDSDDGDDLLSRAMGGAPPDLTRGVSSRPRDLSIQVYGWRTTRSR